MIPPSFDENMARLADLAQADEVTRNAVEGLQANYRRRAWRLEPVIHLTVAPEEDALYVEFSGAAGVRRPVVHDLLCIEFDGKDIDSMPVALCLEEFGRDPNSPAAIVARKLMGETAWRRAGQLAEDDLDDLEDIVCLEPSERDSLVRAWREHAVLPRYAVGVRLVPGCVCAVLVDATTGKQVSRSYERETGNGEEQVAWAIAGLVQEVMTSERVGSSNQVVVGVEIGGPVNHETGVVEHYNKLSLNERWREVDLACRIKGLLSGVPTTLVNDAEALGALYVWESTRRIIDRTAVVYISEGIGSALIVAGRVDRRFPMEVGNIPIEPDTGPPCSCGMRGCVEATAGLGAILAAVSDVVGRRVSLAEAISYAENSDAVLAVFNRAGDRLALGMAASQYFVDPRRWIVFLPPEFCEADNSKARAVFLRELGEFGKHVAWEGFKKDVTIEQRLGGPEEGAHGAGLTALDNLGVPVLDPRFKSRR